MANELSCHEPPTRKTDERGAVPAPVPAQDEPPVFALSGADFYHAACVAAHARLSKASPEVKQPSTV